VIAVLVFQRLHFGVERRDDLVPALVPEREEALALLFAGE